MKRKQKTTKLLKADPLFLRQLITLVQGGKVHVLGLGTFEVVEIKSRRLYHNFSGKVKRIKAYKRLKFSQEADIKKKLTLAKVARK